MPKRQPSGHASLLSALRVSILVWFVFMFIILAADQTRVMQEQMQMQMQMPQDPSKAFKVCVLFMIICK